MTTIEEKDIQIAELERKLEELTAKRSFAAQDPREPNDWPKVGVMPAPDVQAPRPAHAQVADAVSQALMKAGKERIGKEINAQLVAGVKHLLGDKFPQGHMTDILLPIVTPIALLYAGALLEQTGSPLVPAGAVRALQKVGTYALEGVTQEAVDAAVNKALPVLGQLMQLAAGLPELPEEFDGRVPELAKEVTA